MNLRSLSVFGVLCGLCLSGCVLNFKKVAEDKPGRPVEHAIFFFGIPVYLSSDTSHSGCALGPGACPMEGMKGMKPMPPMPPPHFRGGPGAWGRPGHWGRPSAEKKDCCEAPADGAKKMECCEKHGADKKMECCEEGEKSKDPHAAHDHSAPAPPKK